MGLAKKIRYRLKSFKRKILSGSNLRSYQEGKLHTAVEVDYLKKLISKYDIDCVFDVGANAGQYALQLRNDVGYKGLVISFEPTPDLVEGLTSISKSQPNWSIQPKALGSENGTIEFHCMASSTFNSIHEPLAEEAEKFKLRNTVSETITVEQETLSSAFKRLRNQFGFKRPMLKMDTQGHDLAVFGSGLDVVDQFVAVQSELSFQKLYADTSRYNETIEFYERHGFVLSALIPNNAGHFPHLLEMDCVMVNQRQIND